MDKRICIVCTSHDRMKPGVRTGVWLEEFVVPFSIFAEAGATIVVASPAGGEVPIDARSITGIDTREHAEVIKTLLDTRAVEELNADEFDAVFFPGGHGPMFDLPTHEPTSRLIATIARSGGTVAAVCHGPAALVGAVAADGKPLVAGRRVTGFSNAEEDQTEAGPVLPFLLQSRLEEQGADYRCADPWKEHVIADDKLITGQNPASSAATAHALLETLG